MLSFGFMIKNGLAQSDPYRWCLLHLLNRKLQFFKNKGNTVGAKINLGTHILKLASFIGKENLRILIIWLLLSEIVWIKVTCLTILQTDFRTNLRKCYNIFQFPTSVILSLTNIPTQQKHSKFDRC